ncbi:MAG: nucleoside hydrolase [Candidatus Wallbacteria bacterium]|nr:nucleoside hydrolase [Candidatus Wallbacteria bacterium]
MRAWILVALLACSSANCLAGDRVPVFLDTDIGSDVDDVLALLTILATPELELVGISTVHGESGARARIARRLLELAGRPDIRVGAGIGTTLLRRKQPRDWSRELRQHLDAEPRTPVSSEHGVDLMIQAARRHPGLKVLAIGPLTNVAVAILKDPELPKRIGQLMVVGGATHFPPVTERGTIFVDYKSEYNLNCDPDAAALVFESGVPILMSGLAPALEVTVEKRHLEEWRRLGTPVASWTVARVEERLARHASHETHLGDVLGCVLAHTPELAQVQKLPVSIEMWGQTLRTVIDPTGSGRAVDVVMTVHREKFMKHFLESMNRILSAERPAR